MTIHVPTKVTAAATILLLLSTAAGPALAKPPCFQPADIEADQAMRFQTELMVLSDTCGGDIYRDFTLHNREQIVVYQHQLIEHYRRTGARRPQASLDSFLTRIANELALQDGRETRQAVCGRSADFLAQAAALDKEQFRQRAAELAAENRSGYRRCE